MKHDLHGDLRQQLRADHSVEGEKNNKKMLKLVAHTNQQGRGEFSSPPSEEDTARQH